MTAEKRTGFLELIASIAPAEGLAAGQAQDAHTELES